MQSGTPIILIKEQASFTELLEDREGIILDLENLHYYTLNSAAVFLWKRMRSDERSTAESLSQAMAIAYGISPEAAELDARRFLDELAGNGLITRSEGSEWDALPGVPQPALPATAQTEYETPRLKLSNSLTQVTLSGSSTIATAAIATGGGM